MRCGVDCEVVVISGVGLDVAVFGQSVFVGVFSGVLGLFYGAQVDASFRKHFVELADGCLVFVGGVLDYEAYVFELVEVHDAFPVWFRHQFLQLLFDVLCPYFVCYYHFLS